jgi:hypothetical protein
MPGRGHLLRVLGLSLPPPCAELVFVSVGLFFMVRLGRRQNLSNMYHHVCMLAHCCP